MAEVEFNSMPPDATLLPNVEVNSLYELSLILVVVIKLNYDFRFTERRSGTDRCQECIIPTRRRSDFMTVGKIYELISNHKTSLYFFRHFALRLLGADENHDHTDIANISSLSRNFLLGDITRDPRQLHDTYL